MKTRRPLKKLVTVPRDGRIAWNVKHYHTLVLITLWSTWHRMCMLRRLSYWKSRDNMLYEWLEILHAAAPDFEIPARDGYIKQIGAKMCVILTLVAEEVAKDEEKMVLVSIPRRPIARLGHPEQTTFRCPHILTGPDTGHA
jgi:hypothetical protein